ncbi:hypothetical protein HDU84_001208 [Entophlyctis sp. JEL0112]|nr:hypothetical protein HDU84_001208 [Entophlyctis sp. JEL0112]
MVPGLSSTLYLPGVPNIIEDLNSPQILVTLTLSLFILFNGLGSLFWSSISDSFFMRRRCYILAMLVFSIASIGCYFVKTINGLIVLRCVQSVGSSVANALGAGSISDLFVKEERGSAVGLYSAGAAIGPLIGPVIGGALSNSAGWRSTFLFATAFGLLCCLLHILFVPETHKGDTATFDSNDAAPAVRKSVLKNIADSLSVGAYDYVFLASVAGGFPFAIMFTHETIIPTIYEEQYGLSSTLVGISFLSGGFCNVLASVMSGKASDYYYKKAQVTREKALLQSRELSDTDTARDSGITVTDAYSLAQAEDRITPFSLFCGFVVIPAGTLMFGLSVSYNASLALPIVGMGFICFGFMDSVVTTVTFLVDALTREGRASSGTGVAMLFRNLLAAVLSAVAVPWMQAMGIRWIGIIAAIVSWIATGGMLYLKLRGQKMRERRDASSDPRDGEFLSSQ